MNKKKELKLNELKITEMFNNDTDVRTHCKNLGVCYQTYLKNLKKELGINLIKAKAIYLYDTLQRQVA